MSTGGSRNNAVPTWRGRLGRVLRGLEARDTWLGHIGAPATPSEGQSTYSIGCLVERIEELSCLSDTAEILSPHAKSLFGTPVIGSFRGRMACSGIRRANRLLKYMKRRQPTQGGGLCREDGGKAAAIGGRPIMRQLGKSINSCARPPCNWHRNPVDYDRRRA